MRIGLLDLDYKKTNPFPNLALMKISAWHKEQGNNAEWYLPFNDRYDIVYVSKVFSFSEDYTDVINADKVVRGGTGYQIGLNECGKEYFLESGQRGYHIQSTLPPEIEHIYPDYSLYNITNAAYGFLTRGCPRGCSFCHVTAKEGKKSIKVADLSEFWNGQKNIVLLDPNLLACKERQELLEQLIDSKAKVDFTQGLDARMLNDEMCDMLSKVKIKKIHFAWDRYDDKDVILPKLKMYAEHTNIKPQCHNAIVYTLVNYDTNIEQDLERIYTLREMGYWAYVMIYDKEHAHKEYHHLQRWCNNRRIFAKCPRFEDYLINYESKWNTKYRGRMRYDGATYGVGAR